MTLVARILIGAPPEEPTIPFPAPRRRVGPLNLGIAATLLLNEDHTVNRREVYRRIGFDAKTAQRLMVEPRPGETEERTQDEAQLAVEHEGDRPGTDRRHDAELPRQSADAPLCVPRG